VVLPVSAFSAEKNKLFGDGFVILIEIEFAAGSFVRYAQYNEPVIFEGHTWQPFPIGSVDVSQSAQGDIPAFDITLSTVGRDVMSVLEFYEIEGRPGRVVWVHPDFFGDPTAKIEESFIVVTARADVRNAVLTVAPVVFDPFNIQLPAELVTSKQFPGVLGSKGRFSL
jgi:hypothetical protein